MGKWISAFNIDDEDILRDIVMQAGCQFIGVKRHFEDEEPLVYFNIPGGSTKTLPVSQVTLENVQKKCLAQLRSADKQSCHCCGGCQNFQIDLQGIICVKANDVIAAHSEIDLDNWMQNFMQENGCDLFESSYGEKKPVMTKRAEGSRTLNVGNEEFEIVPKYEASEDALSMVGYDILLRNVLWGSIKTRQTLNDNILQMAIYKSLQERFQ